ncbi:hypothetical protein GAO09_11385 [Rhizobiales bacterium RZME27]|uniref:Uncharacterized protein n=1 Tax=Endobacterium cereale TaxID=2663029 RepID=A0A6A8A6A6_9HYPH|nr:hypothetical protein [Endobacterium cereale]MEB2848350.1 hypothetical protein [Endobacterium cereale]MQY46643.1 hypothetical protein [Endobacterium cereale]
MIGFSTSSTRLTVAVRMTAQALDDAYGWLVLWLPLVPVILISGAVVVAGFDASSSSFGLRFLAGLVVTGNCFVVTIGGFFSTLFFAGLTWKLSSISTTARELPFEPQREIGALFWVTGLILTVLWAVPFAFIVNQMAMFIRGI